MERVNSQGATLRVLFSIDAYDLSRKITSELNVSYKRIVSLTSSECTHLKIKRYASAKSSFSELKTIDHQKV